MVIPCDDEEYEDDVRNYIPAGHSIGFVAQTPYGEKQKVIVLRKLQMVLDWSNLNFDQYNIASIQYLNEYICSFIDAINGGYSLTPLGIRDINARLSTYGFIVRKQ